LLRCHAFTFECLHSVPPRGSGLSRALHAVVPQPSRGRQQDLGDHNRWLWCYSMQGFVRVLVRMTVLTYLPTPSGVLLVHLPTLCASVNVLTLFQHASRACAGGGHGAGRDGAGGDLQRLLRRRLPHVAPHEGAWHLWATPHLHCVPPSVRVMPIAAGTTHNTSRREKLVMAAHGPVLAVAPPVCCPSYCVVHDK